MADEELEQEPEKEVESEEQQEEKSPVKRFPGNKYELAIVAAREARRLNEAWRDPQARGSGRVTDLALDRVKKGEVSYTLLDED